MKELLVKSRLYNNLLREARLAAGYKSCRALGQAIWPDSDKRDYVAELESFARPPVGKYLNSTEWEWRDAAIEIANHLGISPEELWPPEMRGVKKVKPIFREISLDEAKQITGRNPLELTDENPTPEQQYDIAEMKEVIEEALSTLSPREERVLRMRFGIGEKSDHTLEEVGQDFEVTRERIRVIENKALRKLRGSYLSKKLKEFA